MVTHDNIHIPKESFPHWIWYAAECVGLIVISFLAAVIITDSFGELPVDVHNYMIAGIVGVSFLIWYIGIRGFILKKKILRNRY
jgi:hypothetical protein